MFERDPVNANALSRWHRTDEPTGLQVSLSKGYFSFRCIIWQNRSSFQIPRNHQDSRNLWPKI